MKKVIELYKKIKRLPGKYKIIGLISLAVIGYFIFSNSNKAVPLQFATVKRENIQEEIAGAGMLTGKNSANLHFRSGGQLAYINVDVGDEVFRGQVIAGLDTVGLNIDLREAENTLRDKRAIVDKIKDDQKDVGASETYSQRQTRTTAEVAQDNAYEAYLSAKKALSDSIIYSPIPGIVTQAIDVVDQNITTADLIAQIVDKSEMYFDTEIDEADIGKIEIGLTAEIILDAYPETVYKGSVDQVLPQIKSTTSGANVITVRLKLDSAPDNFVNGLSGEALITINSVENVLSIPLEALREDNTVFVQTEKGLTAKKVVPGISSDTNIEIKEGLEENERVLLNPPSIETSFIKNRSLFSGISGHIKVGVERH